MATTLIDIELTEEMFKDFRDQIEIRDERIDELEEENAALRLQLTRLMSDRSTVM